MSKKKRQERPKEFTRRQLSQVKKQKRYQRIAFISGVAVITVVVVLVVVGWFLGEYRPMHQTVIRVGEVGFDTRYYIDALKLYASSNPDKTLGVISNSLPNTIIQNEMIRQKAAELGIVVKDEDLKETLKEAGLPVNRAYLDFTRISRLAQRLKDEHFSKEVPVSDNQVHMMAMMLESESVALKVRERLLSGDNFTALAEEFARNYYSRNVNKGDFGWHPASILKDQVGAQVVLDYAFSAPPGELSMPIADNTSYKQLGYWLINVKERNEEGDPHVYALLLGSEEEALAVRARLEAGDNITALAKELSQYSASKESGGDLGELAPPASPSTPRISEAFDKYAFNAETPLDRWSEPIRDETYWTQGGYWLVKVIDREENRPLSEEDRQTLINRAYSDWVSQLWVDYAADISTEGLTAELEEWAISRAEKALVSQRGR
ncbi:MAG: peptidylprolyl isomerase [Dehalococcoidales bacterium]|nr:peptidylprolyl isomerase [Dehalococcoidales bacterium]